MKRYAFSLFFLAAHILGFSLLLSVDNLTQVVFSQEAPETLIKPTKTIRVPAAVTRTMEDIHRAEQANPSPAVGFKLPFRPTMDYREYRAAKEAAERELPSRQPEVSPPVVPFVPFAPPTLKGVNVDGIEQSCDCSPPDTHGAAGRVFFVEVTNSEVYFFNKSDGSVASVSSLASLFGYYTKPLFDPRVVYDPMWQRFVITAVAFP